MREQSAGAPAPGWREVAAAPRDPNVPLLVVHGNCQAEALRVLAAGALGGTATSVRVPPVFELGANDIEDYHRLLRRTDLLVTQPIVDDYRGLPLGTAQVSALLPAAARVARVPVLRWAALMPTHAIVRVAGVGDPPLVPYHDLHVVAGAARGRATVGRAEPSARGVRAIREITRAQLRIRQEAHGTVDALPTLEAAGAEAVWTIKHPGNAVLTEIARLAFKISGTTASTCRTSAACCCARPRRRCGHRRCRRWR